MHLSDLVAVVEAVRATSKRTEKVRRLADFLRKTRGDETEIASMYLTGSLPQGKIGVGGSLVQKIVVAGPPVGEAVTVADLDRALTALAADTGAGSAARRIEALSRLFARATPAERQFMGQLLVGEIRQGALEGVLLDAIAAAAGLPAEDVRQAAMFAEHVGQLARSALEEGAAGLSRYALRLFRPVAPMLADSADDVEEALERLGRAAFEYKLDGVRIQVHKGGDDVRIFTRQLQDVTGRLPDLVDWTRSLPVQDAVLDGEAIALRPDGRPQPFQVTMRRLGRGKDNTGLRESLPLTPFVFDALYCNGHSLLGQAYEERTRILRELVPPGPVRPLVTADAEEARRFFERALEAGHEGVMAKSLTAPYAAGQRGGNWLKLKSATTLDLVVLAAEWGNGRREGWLSNLHLGARDAAGGQFVMLGKTFKGLTDELLAWQTEKLLALEAHREGSTVYVRPELVVESAFNDLQDSPRYPAGLALRFARVIRYRPDKSASEADTIQTVTDLFRKQRS